MTTSIPYRIAQQARLDRAHALARAEFDQARTDDPAYNLTRAGKNSPNELSTETLGKIIAGEELNGWARAVIRDELYTRAAEDYRLFAAESGRDTLRRWVTHLGTEILTRSVPPQGPKYGYMRAVFLDELHARAIQSDKWRTTTLTAGTTAALGHLLENPATLHKDQPLTRRSVLDELHARALLERPAALVQIEIERRKAQPLGRAALDVLKKAELQRTSTSIKHVVTSSVDNAEAVRDLIAHGLLVKNDGPGWKVTSAGISLRLRLV
jgi:hypothetical protein